MVRHKVTVQGHFYLVLMDIIKLQTSGTVISYADDTTFLCNSSRWEDLKRTVKQDIVYIKCFFDSKRLALN